jgi:hypothetical protein
MTGLALGLRRTRAPRWPRSAALRAICGGAVSGLALTAGLAALSQACGGLCLTDLLVTAAVAVTAGIAAAAPAALTGARA